MRLCRWQKGVFAFGNVVSVDPTQSDAWANLASCFLKLPQKDAEALLCVEQAIKMRRTSWRLWENLQRLAISTNHLAKAIWATRELLNLPEGKERIRAGTIA